ncbi:MAG: energy transducer TonB [Alistipes sp.]|nr:energy transducer TonB [Alistipes sp.]
MEIKKSPKADLQDKRMLFLLLGLAIALGLTLLAFSINSKPTSGEYTPPKRETTEMEQIDNTRQDQMETPPEQQKAQAQVLTDVLNIVSNDQKIETNVVFVEDANEFDDFEIIIEEKEEEIVEEEIFFTVEEMPKFRGGGLPEFRNWVQQNVKYPQIALENGIQGNVVVQFVVGADGKMQNFKVLQSPDKTLSDATIEVLKKANEMKNGWKPGKQRGKPVKVSFTLPVAFKIQI